MAFHNLPKITDEMLADFVRRSKKYSDVIHLSGRSKAGGTHAHYSARIKKLGLDTSHFEKPKRKGPQLPFSRDRVLVRSTTGDRQRSIYLRRAMIESGVIYQCAKCGNPGEHNELPLTLQVDHLDGDWKNNLLDNLRFLCPNCHSQTPTYGRNKIPKTERRPSICSCGKQISRGAKACQRCTPRPRHLEWPSPERLGELVDTYPIETIGKMYGVSGNAVRRWIKRYKTQPGNGSNVHGTVPKTVAITDYATRL